MKIQAGSTTMGGGKEGQLLLTTGARWDGESI